MTSQRSETMGETARPTATTFSSAALAATLLDRSPLLVYAIDLHGRVLLMNRALCETTGWSETDCPDLDALLERLYPDPEYREVVRRVHLGSSRNSQLTDTELTLRGSDGSEHLVSWSTGWLTDREGKDLGYAFFGSDVTTARNLRHLLFLFRSAVENVTEGVIVTDPAGRIIAWNSGATELLGHESRDMEGRLLAELYGDNEALAHELENALSEGGFFTGTFEVARSDSSTRSLHVRIRRLEIGAGAQAARLCVLSPPSREDKLSAQIAQLEQQLHQQVAAFEQQLQQATEAGAQQESRIGEMGKELREATASAEETLETVRREAKHEIASVQESLNSNKGRVDELLSRNENLRDQLRDAEARVAAGETRAGDAERECTAAEHRSEAANERAAEAQDRTAAAEAQVSEAEARIVEIEQSGASLKASLAKAEDDVESAKAELNSQEQELERLGTALAESRVALESSQLETVELTRKLEAVQDAQRVEGDKALEEAQDRWDRERQGLDERHRGQIETMRKRLASERLALEDQLSLDILAAEERAAAERGKVVDGHERERGEWESAMAIAEADAETRYRAEIEVLRRRLDSGGGLQTHLLASRAVAVAAANMSGVVVGWSGGAAELDGRNEESALGSLIHQDVLRLKGVDWKSLVGKIIIAGHLEQEHVLVRADGKHKRLLLIADLVKGAGGNPIGLTEFLVPRMSGELNEAEITDVSDIMELVAEDDTESMSLRGALGDMEPHDENPADKSGDSETPADSLADNKTAASPGRAKKTTAKKTTAKKTNPKTTAKKTSGRKKGSTSKKAAGKKRASRSKSTS